jgi:ribosomal protein S8
MNNYFSTLHNAHNANLILATIKKNKLSLGVSKILVSKGYILGFNILDRYINIYIKKDICYNNFKLGKKLCLKFDVIKDLNYEFILISSNVGLICNEDIFKLGVGGQLLVYKK